MVTQATGMKALADHVALLLIGVSGFASSIAPLVSLVAGVIGSVWGCIRIYEWIKSKKVPAVNKD